MESIRRVQRRGRPAKPVHSELTVELRWIGMDALPYLFTNQLFVRLQEGQFLVTFGSLEMPYETEISQESKARLVQEGAPVQTVARLAIAPEQMGNMIEHLTSVHKIWLDRQSQGAS